MENMEKCGMDSEYHSIYQIYSKFMFISTIF